MHPLWQIEGPSLLWIQVNLRQDWLTPIMQVITRFGDGGIFWIGFCILLLCIPKSRRTGIAASLSLALNGLVTNACLKNIIGRIRPYVRFPELTVYEQRFLDLGQPIYQLAAVRQKPADMIR